MNYIPTNPNQSWRDRCHEEEAGSLEETIEQQDSTIYDLQDQCGELMEECRQLKQVCNGLLVIILILLVSLVGVGFAVMTQLYK